jgi:3-dehydroquinate dehydratase-2
MSRTVFVLNGPNLNLLGTREPDVYGSATLDEIAAQLTARASELGVSTDIRQSNHEGHLIDWLHEAGAGGAHAVILNAGGYSHTSIAIRDAVAGIAVPVIEVHLSNIFAREAFRKDSLIAPVAKGCIIGLGADVYVLALDAAARLCKGAGTPAGSAGGHQ